ncbi:hypothetical protein V6N13_072145 [Hibiscus sabdariffa]|uniref:Uncharacterized protein n=1 Tax=Hibiscus sabdariffa TaxID=183260 RepID=A0ABR2TBC3_9ROSI
MGGCLAANVGVVWGATKRCFLELLGKVRLPKHREARPVVDSWSWLDSSRHYGGFGGGGDLRRLQSIANKNENFTTNQCFKDEFQAR